MNDQGQTIVYLINILRNILLFLFYSGFIQNLKICLFIFYFFSRTRRDSPGYAALPGSSSSLGTDSKIACKLVHVPRVFIQKAAGSRGAQSGLGPKVRRAIVSAIF